MKICPEFFLFFSVTSGGLIELVILWKCVGKKVKSFVSLSGCVKSLKLFSLRVCDIRIWCKKVIRNICFNFSAKEILKIIHTE